MTTTFPPAPSARPPASGPAKPSRPPRAVLIGVSAATAVLVGAAVVVAVILFGYIAAAPQIPDRAGLWSIRRSPGMTFLDRNGRLIATRGAKNGQAATLAELPAYVPKAFLAAEDKRFYQHGPVDMHAIARAIAVDLAHKRSAEGASTLTQQLARTLFLKRDPSLRRKVQEAYLAWKLEQGLSKDDILDLYLNRTYFGDGAYGINAASQTYFGKPASQLNLIEAATLAGLPNAPSRLALTNDMPDALARAHKILATMREQNWISEGDLAAALATQPVLATPHNNEGVEGYVLDAAAAEASQLANGQAVDLIVKTTIDPNLQTAATDAVRSVVLSQGRGRRVSQGALVSLGQDGAILAMVGGLDHDTSAFNRVTQAKRQPGSAFKAFVYGAAIEHGMTEQTVRYDAPVSYGNWNPGNYGGGYAGAVTLQQALARSLNTVSVRLTLEVGPDAVAAFAHRLGVADVPDHPGPSIALGAYEVTPLELAGGYQVFQDGGGRTAPYLVSQISTTSGQVIWSHDASAPTPVLDPLFATRMVNMMKTVITSGTGTGANIGRPTAGKTGTSQDWRDAWFVGFTPDILTAVWVGNDSGAPMAKVTGGELPAAIWKKFMTVAEAKLPPRDFPWLVAEPNMPPNTMTVADQSPPDLTPYEDQPMAGDGGGAQASSDEPPGGYGGYEPPPRDPTYAARGGGNDRTNPYAADPYARDPYARGGYARGPYDDPGAQDDGGVEEERPPPPRRSRIWRDESPPDYQDDEPPPAPRYEDRRPYSGADDDPRDGY